MLTNGDVQRRKEQNPNKANLVACLELKSPIEVMFLSP
jgi:hypothetical protein